MKDKGNVSYLSQKIFLGKQPNSSSPPFPRECDLVATGMERVNSSRSRNEVKLRIQVKSGKREVIIAELIFLVSLSFRCGHIKHGIL